MDDMARRIVVTGASSGIGLATAKQLAAAGHEVVMVSRDSSRGGEAFATVAELATGPLPTFLSADLSSQASIRELSARLHDRFSSIDVLINNAGTASARRELTVDGIERTFATNHLAPFLLTHLVIDLLWGPPAASSGPLPSRTRAGLTWTTCMGSATTTSSPPTQARSSPTSSSPTSFPGALAARGSPPTASHPAPAPRISDAAQVA